MAGMVAACSRECKGEKELPLLSARLQGGRSALVRTSKTSLPQDSLACAISLRSPFSPSDDTTKSLWTDRQPEPSLATAPAVSATRSLHVWRRRMPMRHHFFRAQVAALGFAAALATTAHAQSGPTWIALDAQPQGTPASVVFNAALSSASTSVLDVTIHGFWSTQMVGSDAQVYQSLEVPGLPNKSQHGAPNLPVCRFDLGLTNGADAATLQPPIVFASQSLPGYMVWPKPIDATMEDPEVFQRDAAIYSTPGPWPANNGGSSIHNLMGFLPAASCETYPFHWDPISGVLTVATSVRYQFAHNGPGTALPLTTPAQRNVASNLLANWQTIGSAVAVDNTTYSGYYLIITPMVYQTSLQPLVDQKKA